MTKLLVTPPRLCEGTNAKGARCGQHVPEGVTLCVFHDPAAKDALAELRAKGQAATVEAAEARRTRQGDPQPAPDIVHTVDGIGVFSAWLAMQTVTGQLDSQSSSAAGRHLDRLLKVISFEELQAKLRASQAALAELQALSHRQTSDKLAGAL